MCRTTWEFRRCFVGRAANQPSEWHQGLDRSEPWFHSIAPKELLFPPELNPLYSTSLDTLVRWKVASSASTSTQDFSCPKTMDFCFSTTYAWRAAAMRENISSIGFVIWFRWQDDVDIEEIHNVGDLSLDNGSEVYRIELPLEGVLFDNAGILCPSSWVASYPAVRSGQSACQWPGEVLEQCISS